ncbi:MAG: hypothetical protein ABIY46_15965, partial [Gemmatimonadales bacterium]
AVRMFLKLDERVMRHTARLLQSVDRPHPVVDWERRHDEAVDALRDHWWVQQTDRGAWVDLDPLPLRQEHPDEVLAAIDLPAELYHELTVSVLVERSTRGGLRDSVVLTHTLRPSAMPGEPIALQFWPTSWPKELHPEAGSKFGLRGQALEQQKWVAGLMVDGKVVAQAPFGASGAGHPSSGGLFGGLRGGIADAVGTQPPPSADDLTAAWIEYQLRAPDRPRRVMRRAVFDLLGPAARAGGSAGPLVLDDTRRLTRSLALMMRVEILPVTCRIAPEFVMHLWAQSLLANEGVLHTLVGSASSANLPDPDSLLARAAPPVSPLYSLALARLAWSRFSDRLYVDQLGLLTRHRHAGPAGRGIVLRGAVEIVAKDIGISLAEKDAFPVRLEQGVLDTNAEGLWWLGEGINNTAEAFNSSPAWVPLTSARGEEVDRLSVPADARVRIKDDLAAGLIVVAPSGPVRRGPDEFVGWWRIDRVTGATAGTTGNGWAQCGSEYSVHLTILAEYANAWAFEYAFCHGMVQAMNGFKYLVAELRARGFALYGGEINIADPMELLQRSERGCVLGAFLAASMSIMPYLIIRPDRWAEFGLVARRLRSLPPGRGPQSTPELPQANSSTPPKPAPPAPPEAAPPSAPKPASPASPAQPGRGRYDPRPAEGKVPPGKGPFQGDPANRDWLRENWDADPLKAHPGARAMGSPEIYDQADRAAIHRYNEARAAGAGDEAARQQSFDEWWKSVQDQRRARGVYQFPGVFPAEPGGGAWQEWVPEPGQVQATPTGTPIPSGGAGGTVGLGPPPGSPPPGGGGGLGGTAPMGPPLGSPPPGSKIAVGSGGVAQSFFPIPWPD